MHRKEHQTKCSPRWRDSIFHPRSPSFRKLMIALYNSNFELFRLVSGVFFADCIMSSNAFGITVFSRFVDFRTNLKYFPNSRQSPTFSVKRTALKTRFTEVPTIATTQLLAVMVQERMTHRRMTKFRHRSIHKQATIPKGRIVFTPQTMDMEISGIFIIL